MSNVILDFLTYIALDYSMEKLDGLSSIKIGSLQDLRAVAVLLVLLVHAINVVDFRVERGLEHNPGFISTFLFINEFGCVGVDLFFVISGIVMAILLHREKRPSPAEFISMRFLRIVPLFWLAAALYTLLTAAMGRPLPGDQLLAEITIIPVSLFHYAAPLLIVGWTLAFELFFYFLVASVLPCSHPVVALSMLLAALIGVSILFPAPAGLLAIVANPIQLDFLWGIGSYALYRRLMSHPLANPIGATFLSLGIAAFAVQIVFGFPFDGSVDHGITAQASLPRALYWGLPSAMIAVGLLLASNRLHRSENAKSSVLRATGDASYSIYLTHLSILMLVEVLLPANIVQADVLIISMIIASWAIGMVTYLWIEQPFLMALKTRQTMRRSNLAHSTS